MKHWVYQKDCDFVIKNDYWDQQLESLLFSDGSPYEVEYIEGDLLDILVAAGSFSSRSQARKNGWEATLAPGFTQYHVGHRTITVWNPVK